MAFFWLYGAWYYSSNMTQDQSTDKNIPVSIFPSDFLWGSATASHQVEGNTVNDWSEWERVNAERLAQESVNHFGYLPQWERVKGEATNPESYLSGESSDHFHRYEEDFDLMKTLRFNVYRFSLEWSRIEPEKGLYDENALNHYRQMVQSLKLRGIEPFVTLWHWTLPLWLRDEGGILSPDFASYFLRYAQKVLSILGEEITFVVTLNEPDVVTSHAYLKGVWPPQEKSVFKWIRANLHLVIAHKKVYMLAKQDFTHLQIGIAKHNIAFEVLSNNPWNRVLKFLGDALWNRWWLNRIKNHQDFIGLNHYNRNVINSWFGRNPNKRVTDFGWEFVPESLTQALVELKPYHKPIYVTENGLADATDELRQEFIPRAVAAVEKALEQGAPVKGYMYWSFIDNFEWDKGYWLKFGLIEVNRTTQTRQVRPSAIIYKKLIKQKRGL